MSRLTATSVTAVHPLRSSTLSFSDRWNDRASTAPTVTHRQFLNSKYLSLCVSIIRFNYQSWLLVDLELISCLGVDEQRLQDAVLQLRAVGEVHVDEVAVIYKDFLDEPFQNPRVAVQLEHPQLPGVFWYVLQEAHRQLTTARKVEALHDSQVILCRLVTPAAHSPQVDQVGRQQHRHDLLQHDIIPGQIKEIGCIAAFFHHQSTVTMGRTLQLMFIHPELAGKKRI